MLIPLDFAVTVSYLHKAHAALEKPPRHQALPAEILSHGIVNPVKFFRRIRFAGDILRIRHGGGIGDPVEPSQEW